MNSFLGIEMTNHQAFMVFLWLSLISAAMFVGGLVLDKWADHKQRYGLCIIGCYMAVFGGLGVIVFSMLGGCFK